MKKLFKTIDEKLADIGLIKVEDNSYVVSYERRDERYGFTQVVDILHKASGHHNVQSYDRELFDDKNIGNTCVGLTCYEMKLLAKKMKEKGWTSK